MVQMERTPPSGGGDRRFESCWERIELFGGLVRVWARPAVLPVRRPVSSCRWRLRVVSSGADGTIAQGRGSPMAPSARRVSPQVWPWFA